MSIIIEGLISLLSSSLMQRSLIAALLVGLSGPVMGTYLVRRRLAMLGDGIGHVSLTGAVLSWLAGTFTNATPQDSWALPDAMITSVLGAITIELIRQSGHTSADITLAMLFHGRIADEVLLIGLADGTSAQLNSYLFDSITTITWDGILIVSMLSVLILLVGVGIAPTLFSMTNDEDFTRPTGLPVRGLSMVIVILSALTVAIAMRIVGSLLASALMVIPVAIAQLSTCSFMATVARSMVYGALIRITGLSFTYFVGLSPGASIIILAIDIYALGFAVRTIIDTRQRTTHMRQVRASAEHPELAHHNEPAERVWAVPGMLPVERKRRVILCKE